MHFTVAPKGVQSASLVQVMEHVCVEAVHPAPASPAGENQRDFARHCVPPVQVAEPEAPQGASMFAAVVVSPLLEQATARAPTRIRTGARELCMGEARASTMPVALDQRKIM